MESGQDSLQIAANGVADNTMRGVLVLLACVPVWVAANTPAQSAATACHSHQECPEAQACVSNECRDPCAGKCGTNAKCAVRNHVAVCSCPPNFKGDPDSKCKPVQASLLNRIRCSFDVLGFGAALAFENALACMVILIDFPLEVLAYPRCLIRNTLEIADLTSSNLNECATE